MPEVVADRVHDEVQRVSLVPNMRQKRFGRVEVSFCIIVELIRAAVVSDAGIQLIVVEVLENGLLSEGWLHHEAPRRKRHHSNLCGPRCILARRPGCFFAVPPLRGKVFRQQALIGCFVSPRDGVHHVGASQETQHLLAIGHIGSSNEAPRDPACTRFAVHQAESGVILKFGKSFPALERTMRRICFGLYLSPRKLFCAKSPATRVTGTVRNPLRPCEPTRKATCRRDAPNRPCTARSVRRRSWICTECARG
jgi:hypothetical protein